MLDVGPSRQQRLVLVGVFVLLLYPCSQLLSGWHWWLFGPLWGGMLYAAWRRLPAPWQGQWATPWLILGGVRYRLAPSSRVLPGVLRLCLLAEDTPEGPACGTIRREVWLWRDSVAEAPYRALARFILWALPNENENAPP
ncbi:MAG: protein YgfX [Aeromonas sp.]